MAQTKLTKQKYASPPLFIRDEAARISVRPTIRQFDGRFYTLPDETAHKFMNSGVAGTYIEYAFCLHSDLIQPDDPWQYPWVAQRDAHSSEMALLAPFNARTIFRRGI